MCEEYSRTMLFLELGQRSFTFNQNLFFSKSFGQSKPQILCRASIGRGKSKNVPGNLAKMVAMPIHGKNPSQIVFFGTGG